MSKPMRHGLLTLDAEAVRATWAGQEVTLTATEFGLLRTLFERRGRVVSRDGLMDGAMQPTTCKTDRTIHSHIRRIRTNLPPSAATRWKRCRARLPDRPMRRLKLALAVAGDGADGAGPTAGRSAVPSHGTRAR